MLSCLSVCICFSMNSQTVGDLRSCLSKLKSSTQLGSFSMAVANMARGRGRWGLVVLLLGHVLAWSSMSAFSAPTRRTLVAGGATVGVATGAPPVVAEETPLKSAWPAKDLNCKG